MKKAITNFAFPLLAIFSCALLVSYTSSKTGSGSDSTPVGTVIYSVLPPEVFLRSNEGWKILDGSALNPEWELSRKINDNNLQIMNGKLPDVSGMFLRAMNYNNIGADPDKSREVGKKQYDMIKDHKHLLTINWRTEPDSHTHEFKVDDKKTKIDLIPFNCSNACDQQHGTDLKFNKIEGYDPNYVEDFEPWKKTLKNEHTHKFKYSDTTGWLPTEKYQPETRPVNIAFYVYIKVN